MANNPRADLDSLAKIQRHERTADFAYTLSKIQWDTFNTLTFVNPVPKLKVCFGMAWRWCRAISEVSGVPYNRLLIALRGEYGESKGRFHFHCLIGGTTTRNIITTTHQQEFLWKGIANGARVECRPYDRSLAGADYLCKCLGANAYELGKFGLADSVTLSRPVFHLMRRTFLNVERHYGDAQMKKQAGDQSRVGMTKLVPSASSLRDETASVVAGTV